MTDPQASAKVGEWIGHDGPMRIRFMDPEHVINAYKTCIRHGNPKADELLSRIRDLGLEYRVKGIENEA